MSANFILITSPDWNIEQLKETIQQHLTELAEEIGEGEVWIEPCLSFERLCALHFSSKNIKFFDSILQIADTLSLKPFPNYCMLGLSTCSLDQHTWNYDSWTSPYGIGLPTNFPHQNNQLRIRVGVIDDSFSDHNYMQPKQPYGPLNAFSQDPNHGTHVAGIIGATKNNNVAMKGVCDNVDIYFYVLQSNPVGNSLYGHFVSEFPNVFNKCRASGCGIVNLSMEWYDDACTDIFVFNMLEKIAQHIELFNLHLVIAAGNRTRNLDLIQIDPHYNRNLLSNGVKVDIFSSLKNFTKRVTIIGASNVFGQLASFSNYGNVVDLVAPGEQILSTEYKPDKYKFRDGTSQSAPLVTGAMALMKLRNPQMPYEDIVRVLKDTADINFTLRGKCISEGRLNLGRALDPRQTISAAERQCAYPLRDEAFIAHHDTLSTFVESMTTDVFLNWYNIDGVQIEKQVSCMLLVKAIDYLNAVDAAAFLLLLDPPSRTEQLTPLMPSVAIQPQLDADLLALWNSLANPPAEVLHQDNVQETTRHEWEHIFELTRDGKIRTAFVRDWARKKEVSVYNRYNIDVETGWPADMEEDAIPFFNALRDLYRAYTVAEQVSINALAIGLQGQYLELWENEKKWLNHKLYQITIAEQRIARPMGIDLSLLDPVV